MRNSLPTRTILDTIMNWFPSLRSIKDGYLYYTIRTLFLPFLLKKSIRVPALRDDIEFYLSMFSQACENFASILSPYVDEIKWPLGKVYNGFVESVDAELYYCFVRRYIPHLIIEVGSGNSAWIAMEAINANGGGKLLAIDPSRTIRIPEKCVHLRHYVQEAPLSLFRELGTNDILFIDSSHTTSEATYHTEKILPLLREGVFIHYHDVMFPYDLYFRGDRRRFGEPDVVLGFLRKNRESYRIVTSAPYVCHANLGLVRSLVPSFRYDPYRRPRSLWIRKTGN